MLLNEINLFLDLKLFSSFVVRDGYKRRLYKVYEINRTLYYKKKYMYRLTLSLEYDIIFTSKEI